MEAHGGTFPPRLLFFAMYVLYLDESGFHNDATYFVLGGLAIFEREMHFLAQEMDDLQRKYFPEIQDPVEFHVSPMRVSDDRHVIPPFNQLDRSQRRQLIDNVYQIIRNHQGVLFGVAIEKAWRIDDDHYARAFEDLVSRFDRFLQRRNSTAAPGGEQRGMIAVAESSYRQNLAALGERFRGGSTRWGRVRNLAEVPFFMPAKNSRSLQLADFCANAIYGRYNSGLTRDFDTIAPKFDREGFRVHGLVHLTTNHECMCPACLSRHPPGL